MSAVALTYTHPAVAQAWLEHGPAALARHVDEHAPGPAGGHVDTWLGQVGKGDGGTDLPALWRVGTAHLPGYSYTGWPVAVPLLDDAHLQIVTTPDTRAAAHRLVESLAARVLSTFRPGLVQVHVWDAREVRGSLPGLYPLLEEGLFTPHDPTQLDDLLEALTGRIAQVRSRLQARGHRSLRAQAQAETDGVRSEPWTLVVLFGDGEPLKGDLHADLQRVARAALPAGISLVTVDVPVALPAHCEQITLDGAANWCTMTGDRVRLVPDLPIEPRRLYRATAEIAAWYADWKVREAGFRDLLPADLGGCSSVEGVAAPIGFSDTGAPVVAELGDATPHALIGGPSGTGKTNLILAWLMALSARYSPRELELYLLDFKEGVSFAPLAGGPTGEGWLPQARLVGVNINEDREFGLALLRYLAAEMRRRAAAAKRVGATKLSELRRADPDGHWPRLVAVMDEVQFLLEPRGDAVTEEAVALIEDLARRGRSQGIHLVLASQNLPAVKALWSRKAILEQFSLRIGLPRAQDVFDSGNKVLANLPRWHAVINGEGGAEHANLIARVPNACAAGTADLFQAELHTRWGDPARRPTLLDGDVSPAAHELWTPTEGAPRVTLGRAFTVHADPAVATLAATPGRNVAVLGAGAHLAPRVLSCAAADLALQGVALDLVAFEDLGASHADWVAAHAPDARRVDGDDVDDHLAALVGEMEARRDGAPRPPLALVIYQVDAMESRYEQKELDLLRTLLHHGPEFGVHVLGWWRSVDRLLKMLRGDASAEDIGVWAVCDVVGKPIGSNIPGMVANAWEPRENRGLLYDRERASEGGQLFIAPTLRPGAAMLEAA